MRLKNAARYAPTFAVQWRLLDEPTKAELKGANVPTGTMDLDRACMRNDKFACELAKKVGK